MDALAAIAVSSSVGQQTVASISVRSCCGPIGPVSAITGPIGPVIFSTRKMYHFYRKFIGPVHRTSLLSEQFFTRARKQQKSLAHGGQISRILSWTWYKRLFGPIGPVIFFYGGFHVQKLLTDIYGIQKFVYIYPKNKSKIKIEKSYDPSHIIECWKFCPVEVIHILSWLPPMPSEEALAW